MSTWYKLEGHTPVRCHSLQEASEALEQNRQVARTEIGDVTVSTVFLGLDHSWSDGPPILFETMIFGGQLDEDQRRYSTWVEAEQGHAEMVAKARNATKVKP